MTDETDEDDYQPSEAELISLQADSELLSEILAEDPRVCYCRCHYGFGLMHIVGCCYRCPGCRRRIQTSSVKDHQEDCPGYRALQELEALRERVARETNEADRKGKPNG